MNKRLRLIYLLLLLFGISIRVVTAQTDFASEEEFKKQAAKLFAEEEYAKAYPLYSQLVSLYRKDPNFNYRLGVCMLYAGEDKERAITFLEFAANSSDVDKERFFYLAKAYHLNYRFDDAINQYKKYKKIASSAKAERLQVDRQIEMCRNGKNLLRTITDLVVIDKTEMNREDFFRSYNISGIGGKLLVKPDEKEFRTSLDKKKNEKSIIYLAANGKQIFFSSYGDNEQHGKDIYEMKKLPSGEWGKPQTLGKEINTDYDEDFPFLHPNGKVLYFCSKGHNSMGGYDIFKSTLNEQTKTWGEPVNLDFPINTPDDDILYITDANETKAYFSSARASAAGKISVYHINVERKPVDVAYIRGTFIKNRNRQLLDVKITVKNLTDNTILGVYNTKPATGAYDIKLPNGGRFLFTVEATDFPTQSEIVEVPVQKEFKPLKQEMSYALETDKLVIKSPFEEAVNDTTYLLALNFIKEKSKLDVSPVAEIAAEVVPKEENPTTEEVATVQPTTTAKTNTKLSNDDIVKIADKDAEDAEAEAKDARQQADIALDFANQKNEQAKGKLKESAALTAAASNATDNIKKQALTDQATALNKEAEQLNKETVITFNLAKKLDMTAASKQEEADLSKQYAKGLEAAVKSNNSTDALAKLAELEKKLDLISQANADRFPTLNSFKKEEEYKKRELDKAVKLSNDLKGELADNATIIGNLKADADKNKSDQEKQGMTNQIAELTQENSKKQKELEQNEIKRAKLQKEYNSIKNETELVSTVIDQSKTGTSEIAAAKVSAIDKTKLEQQVNSIQSTSQTDNDIATTNSDVKNSSSETSNASTNITSVPNTTPKALIDINKKYNTDLTAAEKIKNKNDREKEKADVLKKWAEAIDSDVVKQKLDLEKTTDPEMKALFAKKISDAENSSKEKQKQADQSLAKVKGVEQKEIPLAVGIGTTYGNNNPVDTLATVNNTITPDVKTENNTTLSVKENTTAITTNEPISNAQPTVKNTAETNNIAETRTILPEKENLKADLANNQANDLKAQSDALKSQAAKEKNADAKKAKIKQADDLLKQAKEKKLEATQQIALANKTDYQTNQKQLDVFTEKYSANAEDEISIAEMNNDEGKIYFDKAQKLRAQAETTDSYASKETVNENALNSEKIALEKQKKAIDIYINFKPSAVPKKEPLIANANAVKNTSANNTSIIEKQPASVKQMVQADTLNKQAAVLMERSVDLKFKAVEQKSDPAAQKVMYAQSEDLIKQANEKKLQSSQLIATANKSEYTANQNQLSELAKGSSTNNSADLLKAEIINDEANKYFDKAQKQRTEAASADSYNSKEKALEEASKNETIALQKQKESLDIYNKNKSNPVPSVVSVPMIWESKTMPVASITNTDVVNNRPPFNEVFDQKSKAVYSTKNPIPINEPLPEGLIFKVQIGAFRNPIPQDLFKGMNPITGETTPKGFIRYTAGLFMKYNSADKVKTKIVNLGYKDAFVVAFLNGKRIPINQAYALDAGVPPTILSINSQTENPVQNTATTNNNRAENNTAIVTSNQTAMINQQADIVKPPSVSAISGLFYTVQVGVYSQKVSPGKLHNMEPLFSETTANGNLRYYTGIYKSMSRANEAKEMVVDIGIKDAFVTAYYNGKRISKAEAKQYEMQGDDIFSKQANINKLPVFKSVSKQKQSNNVTSVEQARRPDTFQSNAQPITNSSISTPKIEEDKQINRPLVTSSAMPGVNQTEPSINSDDSGIVFKLQIGAFKEEVPLEIANKFIKIAGKGIKNYKDNTGLTIYTVGNFRTYNEANQLKTEVVAADLTDTFIVAFRNGEKMNVEEAKKISKQ